MLLLYILLLPRVKDVKCYRTFDASVLLLVIEVNHLLADSKEQHRFASSFACCNRMDVLKSIFSRQLDFIHEKKCNFGCCILS